MLLGASLNCAADWRLVLDYLDVLVWPVVVLVALWVFRRRVHDLFERVTEVGGAGFQAKFADAANLLSTSTNQVISMGDAEEAGTPLPIKPKVRPQPFDWSQPPKDLATFHVKSFDEVHGIVAAYENGQPVDIDVSDTPAEGQFRVLTYMAGIVRGSGGLMATDPKNQYRFAAIPPIESDA